MAETRAIGEEAVRQGLRDIHLPDSAAGGLAADLLAALAIGLFAAILIGAALRHVSMSRRRSAAPTLEDRLAHLAGLPEADRQVALLHLLKSHAPDRHAALASSIYRPEGLPPSRQLEAELRDA